MASLFNDDDLSDADCSFKVYYDSDKEAFRALRDYDESSCEENSDSDKEDPFRGPDLQDPSNVKESSDNIPPVIVY